MADQKKPLGPPVFWSETDLTALTTITDEDKQKASKFWKNKAPVRFKKLLDASNSQTTQKGS